MWRTDRNQIAGDKHQIRMAHVKRFTGTRNNSKRPKRPRSPELQHFIL
jgi:hypothetical protein